MHDGTGYRFGNFRKSATPAIMTDRSSGVADSGYEKGAIAILSGL
jgi:hypothetical protein